MTRYIELHGLGLSPQGLTMECAVYFRVFVVMDVVGLDIIVGVGMGSLVLDAVVVDVIMGPGPRMHSLALFYAANRMVLAVTSIFPWTSKEEVHRKCSQPHAQCYLQHHDCGRARNIAGAAGKKGGWR